MPPKVFKVLVLLMLGYLLLAAAIEAGRWAYAYAMVSNAARWGVRYAITGEYNEAYCEEAGRQLGYLDVDGEHGDPVDCIVPDDYPDSTDLTNAIEDRARLFHIRDMALEGAGGLPISADPAVAGDYMAYLSTHDPLWLGQPEQPGYFHVGICNKRMWDRRLSRDFDWGYMSKIWFPLCYSPTDGEWVDDVGNPNDIVIISVIYVHPVILPPVSWFWPTLRVNASQQGVVEMFRTREVAIGASLSDWPTDTPAPVRLRKHFHKSPR